MPGPSASRSPRSSILQSAKSPVALAIAVLGASLLGLAAPGHVDAATDDGLTLPENFTARVFHPGVGKGARHLAVRENGDVLVSRQDGILLALRDTNGDGVADRSLERKVPITSGLQLHGDHVYFSDNLSVSRLLLDDGMLPDAEPEMIVHDFPEQGPHATKDFAIDPQGNLFVNVGAPSNACQEADRTPGSPGQKPCPQLGRHAAVWRFPAEQLAQKHTDGVRFVTGTRNIVGLEWNEQVSALFFAIHGRDQLSFLWPEFYSDAESAEKPAEEFHRAVAGANYGWPYTYFDPATSQRMLAPEYGGDGKTLADPDVYQTPLHAYPAHWAPNDLVFYEGDNFPSRYQHGAFIAWRGSWNRSPQPQAGYRLTFQPMADGVPTGEPENFMTGFAGAETITRSTDARYRPGGLALDSSGRLYVADTVTGRIWVVEHQEGTRE